MKKNQKPRRMLMFSQSRSHFFWFRNCDQNGATCGQRSAHFTAREMTSRNMMVMMQKIMRMLHTNWINSQGRKGQTSPVDPLSNNFVYPPTKIFDPKYIDLPAIFVLFSSTLEPLVIASPDGMQWIIQLCTMHTTQRRRIWAQYYAMPDAPSFNSICSHHTTHCRVPHDSSRWCVDVWWSIR